MVSCNRQQPPSDDQHGVGHLTGTTVNNEVDDKRKAQKTSDDERNRNDFAPNYSVTGIKTKE